MIGYRRSLVYPIGNLRSGIREGRRVSGERNSAPPANAKEKSFFDLKSKRESKCSSTLWFPPISRMISMMPAVAAPQPRVFSEFIAGYSYERIARSLIINADCFEWMQKIPKHSIHGIVTDPPYGVKEYQPDQLEKRSNGNGGIWRIPPSFDGSNRQPLPRFTALNVKEREQLSTFFKEWAKLACHVLRPGGHVLIACNSFLCQLVYSALVEGGLEFRGQLIRIVRTLRGGDRPKNAEEEFPGVCSLPRGNYEPWGILRKPLPNKMKLSECLREFETGGLRRPQEHIPFGDLIASGRTPTEEKEIANHPSLKPQRLLRQLVYAVLPLGRGTILDPFMGSGSTVAAAEAVNLVCVGVEKQADYYELARTSILPLSHLILARGQLELAFA